MSDGPNATGPRDLVASAAVLVLLRTSAVALAIAPVVLDQSYSWVEHTTSQAGGQGVDRTQLARLGFVAFGLAVIGFAHGKAGTWRQPATARHAAVVLCLFGVATFPLRS